MAIFDLDEVLRTFDVRSYGATRSWGVCEWEFALSRRRAIIRDPDYYRNRNDLGALAQTILDSALLSAPIRHSTQRPEQVFDPAVTDLESFAAWEFRRIVETRPDIALACEAVNAESRPFKSEHEEGSDEWWREILQEDEGNRYSPLLHESFNKLLVEGPFESDTAYVQVLLSAPDEIIVADFRKWLAKMRKDAAFDRSPVRRFSETELRRWSSNQVLPFLDLQIASWAAEVDIPYHTLGDLLFPELDVDVAEKTRKVTAPLAEELMTWELGEALQAAANDLRRAGRKL